MASTFEYMQFATGVYDASRINEIGAPDGWMRIDWQEDRTFTGFSAGIYKNIATGEVVIAYTGTNDLIADPLNWTAGMGIPAPQIFEAMAYYLDYRREHPEVTDISFTGHSLGGGLASLMSVFFNKQAVVFDQAPFQAAAVSPAVLQGAILQIDASGYHDEEFHALLDADDHVVISRILDREDNIVHHSIEGEVLQALRTEWDSLVGLNVAPISLGDSTATSIQRHSMALLTAIKASDTFLAAVRALPDLVPQL